MAIDRQRLAARLYRGSAGVANGPLPPFVPGYDPKLKPLPYNPEKARALLQECGYTRENPLKITLLAYINPRPYNPVGGEKLAGAIQADLAKVGIECEIRTYAWQEYKDVLFRAEYGDCFVYGWVGDNGDPDNFLSLFDGGEIASSLNTARYSNPRVDYLLAAGRRTMDPAARARIYRDVQKVVLEEAPWVYLTHATAMLAYRPELCNFKLHPTGVVRFAEVYKKGKER